MGYFGAGVVLVENPDWMKLESLPANIGWAGYEYAHGKVWILDFWHSASKRKHYPLTGSSESSLVDPLPGDRATDSFDRIAATLKGLDFTYGNRWLRFALNTAKLLGQPTFLWGADDENLDFACHADPSGVLRIACRFDPFELRYSDGLWQVTPRIDSEDPDGPWSDVHRSRLGEIADLQITEPHIIEGGDTFYEFPVSEWPKSAGDPEEVLSLGTWDPYLNWEEDFSMVYERTTPA